MKNTINAVTTRTSIIASGRKVVLLQVSPDSWLIVKAETDKGKMRSTAPFTLFLRKGDFANLSIDI